MAINQSGVLASGKFKAIVRQLFPSNPEDFPNAAQRFNLTWYSGMLDVMQRLGNHQAYRQNIKIKTDWGLAVAVAIFSMAEASP